MKKLNTFNINVTYIEQINDTFYSIMTLRTAFKVYFWYIYTKKSHHSFSHSSKTTKICFQNIINNRKFEGFFLFYLTPETQTLQNKLFREPGIRNTVASLM